jgi:hypothetical protein
MNLLTKPFWFTFWMFSIPVWFVVGIGVEVGRAARRR